MNCYSEAKQTCITPPSRGGSCRTVRRPIINEIDPSAKANGTANFELRGVPEESFTGTVVVVDSGSNTSKLVKRVAEVTGAFDDKGILSVRIDDFGNPSHTIILARRFLGNLNDNLDENGDGEIDDISVFGNIFDALGVPGRSLDESLVFGTQLNGSDLHYIGSDPTFAFRDECSLEWYAVDFYSGNSNVFNETAYLQSDIFQFNKDPRVDTYGDVNPTRFVSAPPPSACASIMGPIMSEFEPSPIGANPAIARFEMKGMPGTYFSGSVVSIDSKTIQREIKHVNNVEGTFDVNGSLTVNIEEFQDASHTVVLTQGLRVRVGDLLDSDSNGEIDDVSQIGSVVDAIGIPGAENEEAFLAGKILGGLNFKYIGGKPFLVFRDDCTLKWYASYRGLGKTEVSDRSGDRVTNIFDFDKNPTVNTFGQTNPRNQTRGRSNRQS